jgi:hypothetical protein
MGELGARAGKRGGDWIEERNVKYSRKAMGRRACERRRGVSVLVEPRKCSLSLADAKLGVSVALVIVFLLFRKGAPPLQPRAQIWIWII